MTSFEEVVIDCKLIARLTFCSKSRLPEGTRPPLQLYMVLRCPRKKHIASIRTPIISKRIFHLLHQTINLVHFLPNRHLACHLAGRANCPRPGQAIGKERNFSLSQKRIMISSSASSNAALRSKQVTPARKTPACTSKRWHLPSSIYIVIAKPRFSSVCDGKCRAIIKEIRRPA